MTLQRLITRGRCGISQLCKITTHDEDCPPLRTHRFQQRWQIGLIQERGPLKVPRVQVEPLQTSTPGQASDSEPVPSKVADVSRLQLRPLEHGIADILSHRIERGKS